MYTGSYRLWLLFVLTATSFSCGKEFLAIDPPRTQLIAEKAFENDAVATSAVTGIYSRMVSSTAGFASGGIRGISLMAGLYSDELINYNTNITYNDLFTNALNPQNGLPNNYCWNELYQYIYTANSIIENLENADNITATIKQYLLAEAKFVRGFCFFYLTNLYGKVPLYTSTNYVLNKSSAQFPVSSVYQLVIKDLEEAYAGLPSDYSLYNNNRSRPVKWTAAALLSRVYLYLEDWENAEMYASLLIDNPLFHLAGIHEVFVANSNEIIWQLARDNGNAQDASVFAMAQLAITPTYASLRESLFNDFEPSDLRLANWIRERVTSAGIFWIPAKYTMVDPTPITEHSVVFRLAEQYLIRAEARAHQPEKLTGPGSAESDINEIKNRAGIANTAASTADEMLMGIAQERVHELFSEWGHRWFDLKRTNKVDEVLQPLKGANWQSDDVLFPIPEDELLRNLNIVQNPGY